MNQKAADWVTFGMVVVGSVIAVVLVAGLLNFAGDCASSVLHCGETRRRISLIVLAFGSFGLGCYVFFFLRSRMRRK